MKIKKIAEMLNNSFVERGEAIEALILAILAKQHVVLLGPPGTGKTALIRAVGRLLNMRVFTWQLTRFTTPEELFGPVSLKALEQDRYSRVTAGKLPEAELAYLDEVFKANSAILNSLLAVMQEREFFNDGAPTPVPLITLAGASNEVPQEEGLEALYDRFLLRVRVGYIAERGAFRQMLSSPHPNSASISPIISSAELEAAHEAVERVVVPDAILDRVADLRDAANAAGVVASDRRYAEAVSLLRAAAFMGGRSEVIEDDLLVLRHVLWQDPAQAKEVAQLVFSVTNPLLGAVQEVEEGALAAFRKAQRQAAQAGSAKDQAGALMEGIASIKEARAKLAELERQASGRPAALAKVRAAAQLVAGWQAELLKALGV